MMEIFKVKIANFIIFMTEEQTKCMNLRVNGGPHTQKRFEVDPSFLHQIVGHPICHLVYNWQRCFL